MQNAELDHGSLGLTRIKARSHPQPSVSSVVKFCGIRIEAPAVIATFFVFFAKLPTVG